jgi:hypothetical protein
MIRLCKVHFDIDPSKIHRYEFWQKVSINIELQLLIINSLRFMVKQSVKI